ncbi:hypothetical protein PHYPSEUDO_000549 [Phytophthora pseudosyringae]|uniref:Uncharacterized protein n=1 Tax=Phytophthora pseudosyringae TaxID=221518 RepID=A0A8T1W129_9STRA|nr:hypothetical protein PHYPSEUDO_000549 [Phytophthora pseudosyringae]
MSVTAADASSGLLGSEGDAQSAKRPADPHSKPQRRQSKALSISSLSDESSVTTKAVATEACRDVERELAAIETRLSVFRGRRRRDDSGQNAVAPIQIQDDRNAHMGPDDGAPPSPSSSVSSNAVDASSPIFSLSKAQQEAGAVADQVATTLMKCDQLLQRVKSCGKFLASTIR